MQDVSVIVPVYGALPKLFQLCQSMVKQRQVHLRDVHLLDDASPEFNLTELLGAPFRVTRHETNQGFVRTENHGAAEAEGNYLLFLNSDTVCHPQWLDPMVDLMEAHPEIGVVGPKLVFPNQTIQSAGGWYDLNRMPFHRYLGWEASDWRVNQVESVPWVTGAALLTRRRLFEELHGFDEAYGRGYFEDPDYCERVKRSGYTVWYCPTATLTHHVSQSMTSKTEAEAQAAQKSFYNNARRFEKRWAESITPDVHYVAVPY